MTADLRKLWQEAFGDSEQTLDNFSATGFSPDRCHYLCDGNTPVSALYWFDCQLEGKKLAYIYAVATLKSHRGQGLAHRLMTETHEILKQQGYAGAILVPGETWLFAFYKKLGYRVATKVAEFSAVATDLPGLICEISPAEYAAWRKKYLPKGGVVQEGATVSYLATYAKFYKGEDFLLSATKAGETLLVHEILGDTDDCGSILRALTCKDGRFRTPGEGQDFAMFLPFTADCPTPRYFGLALD
jgi:ribosomal protein S18 acetylase RimI-like enzyme